MINKFNEPITEEDRLANEINFYYDLFYKIILEGDYKYGFTWSLGGKNRAVQVDIATGKASSLSPTELGILAIALSLGSESTKEERIAHQYFLMRTGIINQDDLEDHARDMIENARGEHFSRGYFIENNTENAGKIIILRRAYEQLQKQREAIELKDCEGRIILGYVIALLSYKYRIRPYIFDKNLKGNSLVDVYDHLFDGFSNESYLRYIEAGYESIWSSFLSIRDEIALKKGLSTIQEKESQDYARIQFDELLSRMKITSNVVARMLARETRR